MTRPAPAAPAVAAVLAAAVVLAGCGQAAPPPKAAEPPGKPIPCPSDAAAANALDARDVVGLGERRAKAMADRHGCTLVAVVRDGERFAIIANVDPRRLQVEVRDGVVAKIVKVG